MSYAVVTADKAHLFVNPAKITDEGTLFMNIVLVTIICFECCINSGIVKAHLGNEVEIHEYDAVFEFLKKLSDDKKVCYYNNMKKLNNGPNER